MKNLLKNNKGLTLVELLAVIVIIGILSSLAVTAISKLLDRSTENYYKDQEDNIALAAQTYTNDNRNLLPFKTGSDNSVTIKLEILQGTGYIKTVKDKSGKKCISGCVKITKNSKEDYTYKTYLECDDYKTEGYIC